MIEHAAPHLSKPFRDNAFALDKLTTGATAPKPRWKTAIADVDSAMGEAMGQLYVQKSFAPSAKSRAEDLVHHVLDALKSRIEHTAWMSPQTKAKAVAKWSQIVPKIGYPDHWRDWSGLRVVPGEYFRDLTAADAFNHRYDLSKIGKPTDRSQWSMTPQTVNAYYDPTDNTINFPAAILQPPFFDPHADDAVNYGGIGAVIGHEATHGFDDEGSQFDGHGNQRDWWTPADRARFDARTGKLVRQFDAYTPIPGKPDAHVNGQLTLGENIADLGGVLTAYDALQQDLGGQRAARQEIAGYTEDQRFFLSFARIWRNKTRPAALLTQLASNPHSPARLRVDGAVPNVPAFAAAFRCPPGVPMVHSGDARVDIW